MAGSAGLLYTGIRLEKDSSWGLELIQEAEEQVRIIRENLRVAQTRQKSYADNRRRLLEFKEGDNVYLKVSPIRGMKVVPSLHWTFLDLKASGRSCISTRTTRSPGRCT
jgi:hypothetical protein